MVAITAKGIDKLIKEGSPKRTALGGGLYFSITQSGSASFGFRYKLKGKSRLMGLGAFCTVNNSLAIARIKAINLQGLVRQGIDPMEQALQQEERKYAENQAAEVKAEFNQATFDRVALEYIDSKSAEWKNAKHHQQWVNTLTTYAFPIIGKTPVSEIETAQVLKILKPIWTTKTETATRVRTRIELVLDYAEALKLRSGSNPARWRGHLATILPNAAKIRKIEHHPALPYDELQPFMGVLSVTNGIGARALEIAILTASRTFEVLGATWKEFDLEKRVWTVPQERMKAGIEHRIPLSESAMKILTALHDGRISDYVFPNLTNGKPLSNAGMSSVLKRLGRTDITVHGFRSTFRDWVAEKTNTPERIAESALAHRLKDASEAAYQRGDLIEKRQALMTNWANYCYPTKDKVVKLHG
jgi:integrase